MDEIRHKYNIVKGAEDPFTDTIFNDGGYKSLIPGQEVSFNYKKFKVVGLGKIDLETNILVFDLEQVD